MRTERVLTGEGHKVHSKLSQWRRWRNWRSKRKGVSGIQNQALQCAAKKQKKGKRGDTMIHLRYWMHFSDAIPAIPTWVCMNERVWRVVGNEGRQSQKKKKKLRQNIWLLSNWASGNVCIELWGMASHDSKSMIQFQNGVGVGRETKPKKCLHLFQFVRAGEQWHSVSWGLGISTWLIWFRGPLGASKSLTPCTIQGWAHYVVLPHVWTLLDGSREKSQLN